MEEKKKEQSFVDGRLHAIARTQAYVIEGSIINLAFFYNTERYMRRSCGKN